MPSGGNTRLMYRRPPHETRQAAAELQPEEVNTEKEIARLRRELGRDDFGL